MKSLNEEMKKMKYLFDFQKGDIITEGEDKECDCGNKPCTCDEGAYIDENDNELLEDTEGEETFNYGEDEGEDHKEEGHLEDEEKMEPKDRIDAIQKHLDALRDDMSFDEDHEDRDEEGTTFAESKKYGNILKSLNESQIKTLKRFIK